MPRTINPGTVIDFLSASRAVEECANITRGRLVIVHHDPLTNPGVDRTAGRWAGYAVHPDIAGVTHLLVEVQPASRRRIIEDDTLDGVIVAIPVVNVHDVHVGTK